MTVRNDTTEETSNRETGRTHTATLYVWSDYGVTPITGRGGSYVDELARVTVAVYGPKDAREKLGELLRGTQYASTGAYCIDASWWNHNTRQGSLSMWDVNAPATRAALRG